MTEPYKIIEVKESVFADNDREAARLRTQLKQDRTFLRNLMSSPGSGKTTTLRFILDIYQAAFPSNEILLAAPTGLSLIHI